MTLLCLAGGAEFGGAMRAPDLCALELAGGFDVPVVIVPTAAAPDNNEQRAAGNAQRWFAKLGATQVNVAWIVDEDSAEATQNATLLRNAKLIYMLGGFTDYLGRTLRNSACVDAMRDAASGGAVIAGSSAGAMVMCDPYFHPSNGTLEQGLGYVPNAILLPHHKNFGHRWASRLQQLRPAATLIGIDERTGLLFDGESWQVLGGGAVTIYRNNTIDTYERGARVPTLPAA